MWRDTLQIGGPLAVALWLGYLTWFKDRKVDATENRKVDLSEFESLKTELRAQLTEVRSDLAAEKAARMAADQRADKAEDKLDKVAVSLAAHGQWDLLVLAEVRKTNPDFPEPPAVLVEP